MSLHVVYVRNNMQWHWWIHVWFLRRTHIQWTLVDLSWHNLMYSTMYFIVQDTFHFYTTQFCPWFYVVLLSFAPLSIFRRSPKLCSPCLLLPDWLSQLSRGSCAPTVDSVRSNDDRCTRRALHRTVRDSTDVSLNETSTRRNTMPSMEKVVERSCHV